MVTDPPAPKTDIIAPAGTINALGMQAVLVTEVAVLPRQCVGDHRTVADSNQAVGTPNFFELSHLSVMEGGFFPTNGSRNPPDIVREFP